MHIELDKYAYSNSQIHRWDPRFKIISLMALILTFSLIKEFVLLPVLLIISIMLINIARLPFFYLVKRLKYVFIFLLPMVLLLSISSGGEVLYSFYIISMYKEGLMISLLIIIRTSAILFVFFVILETAPFNLTISALYHLHIPQKLINILFFTYRYIYVYLEELRKMRTALRVRGYNDHLNLHSLKTHSGIIGSLLVRSFEQAEQVCSAIVLRGYSGKILVNSRFSACRYDYFKAFLTIIIISVIIGIQLSL